MTLPFDAQWDDGAATWTVPLALYPAATVRRSTLPFLDRYFVELADAPSGESAERGVARLCVRRKEGTDTEDDLLPLLDAWYGELLNLRLRDELEEDVGRLREIIVGRTLHGAQPAPWSLPEAEGEDWLDDPLGIAVPWEQKYGRGKQGDEVSFMTGGKDAPPSEADHPREKASAATPLAPPEGTEPGDQ